MDIVERLRERTDSSVLLLSDPPQRVKDALCQEAAEEIERLRDALSFYASFAKVSPQMNVAAYYIDNGRIAAAALKDDE